MSGLADTGSLIDNLIGGFFVASTMKIVFNRGSFGSILGRQNLMDGAKIGGANHIYQNVLKAPVQGLTNRMGL